MTSIIITIIFDMNEAIFDMNEAGEATLSMLPSILWTACPPVLMLIMIRQDNHHSHPRHDRTQSKTSIPLPSDSFHDKLFPFDQHDVLIN